MGKLVSVIAEGIYCGICKCEYPKEIKFGDKIIICAQAWEKNLGDPDSPIPYVIVHGFKASDYYRGYKDIPMVNVDIIPEELRQEVRKVVDLKGQINFWN